MWARIQNWHLGRRNGFGNHLHMEVVIKNSGCWLNQELESMMGSHPSTESWGKGALKDQWREKTPSRDQVVSGRWNRRRNRCSREDLLWLSKSSSPFKAWLKRKIFHNMKPAQTPLTHRDVCHPPFASIAPYIKPDLVLLSPHTSSCRRGICLIQWQMTKNSTQTGLKKKEEKAKGGFCLKVWQSRDSKRASFSISWLIFPEVVYSQAGYTQRWTLTVTGLQFLFSATEVGKEVLIHGHSQFWLAFIRSPANL